MKTYRIFLASSYRLSDERDAVEQALARRIFKKTSPVAFDFSAENLV